MISVKRDFHGDHARIEKILKGEYTTIENEYRKPKIKHYDLVLILCDYRKPTHEIYNRYYKIEKKLVKMSLKGYFSIKTSKIERYFKDNMGDKYILMDSVEEIQCCAKFRPVLINCELNKLKEIKV